MILLCKVRCVRVLCALEKSELHSILTVLPTKHSQQQQQQTKLVWIEALGSPFALCFRCVLLCCVLCIYICSRGAKFNTLKYVYTTLWRPYKQAHTSSSKQTCKLYSITTNKCFMCVNIRRMRLTNKNWKSFWHNDMRIYTFTFDENKKCLYRKKKFFITCL